MAGEGGLYRFAGELLRTDGGFLIALEGGHAPAGDFEGRGWKDGAVLKYDSENFSAGGQSELRASSEKDFPSLVGERGAEDSVAQCKSGAFGG